MGNIKLYVVGLSLGIAAMGLTAAPVQAGVLDWNAVDYNSGNLSQNFTVAGVGMGFAFSGATNFQSGFSDDTATLTGGLGATEESLQIQVDHSANTDILQLDVTFSDTLNGVSFRIFDIDTGTGGLSFHDRVEVSGFLGSSSVVALLTAAGSTFSLLGGVATGTSQAGNATGDGTVAVSFAGPIDAFRIQYGNDNTAPSDPGPQGIGLHDISFSQVPEPGTLAILGFGLLGLGIARRHKAAQ